jgi:AcrR family transcriptional regulator
MATTSSQARTAAGSDRRRRRRELTITEALDLAEEIIEEHGVGALTISELARRMAMRGPSLYKYFPSLHAVYDALFARGLAAQNAAIDGAIEDAEPGVGRLMALARTIVRWSVEHPGMASLMYWRPIPGFEPTPETFVASTQRHERVRSEFAIAVQCGQLGRGAGGDEAVRLFTVVISGLFTQQVANQPRVSYEAGMFTALTDQALEMFFDRYRPARRK